VARQQIDLSGVPSPGPMASTREQLVVAAEHLFGLYGIEAVSVQKVRTAARQGNRSVVQYHYGGKEGLVRAVFEYRMPRLNARRAVLLDELQRIGRLGDVRSLVEVLVVPLAEEAEHGGSYASFLGQLIGAGWPSAFYLSVDDRLNEASVRCLSLIDAALRELPEPIRVQRIELTIRTLPVQLADRERAVRARSRAELLPYSHFVATLLDYLCGGLLAPVSVPAVAPLDATPGVAGPFLSLV
jgi:AcrR family transcriptional regulator